MSDPARDAPNTGANRTVLVTGATGLVGTRLVRALVAGGERVRVLTRNASRASAHFAAEGRMVDAFAWEGAGPPAVALRGVGAIVHLAGEPVFGGLPTAAQRARIYDSRIRTTDALVDALSRLAPEERPRTLVSASAVGWYGDRGDEPLTEDANAGTGFLAEVCVAWERSAAAAAPLGLRVARARIGIVLAREGGALPKMALPVRLGVGGPIGSGRQFVPWIQADDLVAMLRFVIDQPSFDGPFNATAPEPARNAELTAAIARKLHRPALLRVPAFALRLALGPVADELLGSRRVVPARILEAGFRFASPSLAQALEREL